MFGLGQNRTFESLQLFKASFSMEPSFFEKKKGCLRNYNHYERRREQRKLNHYEKGRKQKKFFLRQQWK